MFSLVRLTKTDYLSYVIAHNSIIYRCSEGINPTAHEIYLNRLANQRCGRTEEEYFKSVKERNREMYIFVKEGKMQGYAEIIFQTGKVCEIFEFGAFDQRRGKGTEMYNLLERMIKSRGTKRIELWCPFPGSQKFWKKMGYNSGRQHDYQKWIG